KVASRKEHEHALARHFPHIHLAKGSDAVHAGICARVRHEGQPTIYSETDAIGHRGTSGVCDRPAHYCRAPSSSIRRHRKPRTVMREVVKPQRARTRI